MSAFERYYTELFRFLSRKLHDRHLAEDMTQEAFSRALSSTQQVSSHRALLYHIAKNLLVDRYRDPQQRFVTEEIPDTDSLLAPGHEQPDSLIENQQYIASLMTAIEALPPRCREAFILHRFDGLSQSEVAVRMGISINMVEKHIIRAMLACRHCRQQWQAVTSSPDTEEARHG